MKIGVVALTFFVLLNFVDFRQTLIQHFVVIERFVVILSMIANRFQILF